MRYAGAPQAKQGLLAPSPTGIGTGNSDCDEQREGDPGHAQKEQKYPCEQGILTHRIETRGKVIADDGCTGGANLEISRFASAIERGGIGRRRQARSVEGNVNL
ncbi:MAG: hypothetical protein E6833_29060, partial [Bradyrhizobium sp.]|nr:hypothetical protein [Bradyrhizobium sp.]